MLSILALRNTNRPLANIVIEYSSQGKIKRWATPYRIPAKYWNKARGGRGGEIKAGGLGAAATEKDLNDANADIRERQAAIDAIINAYFRQNGVFPSVDHVARQIDRTVEQLQASEGYLIGYLTEFIELRKGAGMSNESIKAYTNLRTNLKEFEVKKKVKLTFGDIDNIWMDRFKAMLTSAGKFTTTKRKGKGREEYVKERQPYLNTTVKKRIASLKEFLGYYTKAGINLNQKYKEFTVKVARNVNADVITLDSSEFETVRSLDLSANKRLEYVRDLFVFSCATGLRFSDLFGVSKSSVINNYLHVTTKKTKDSLQIPLNPVSIEILTKYDYSFKLISNQKYNDYIKEIARMVPAFEQMETVITYIGNARQEKQYQKWELISSHTGRRTFVTLLMEKGVNPAVIMKWTGHKSLDMFIRYLNKKQGEQQEMLKAFG